MGLIGLQFEQSFTINNPLLSSIIFDRISRFNDRYRSVDGLYKPLMLDITWTRIKYRDEKRRRLNLNEQVPVFQVHDRRDRSIIRGSEWIMAVGQRVAPNNPLLIEIAILSIMPWLSCSFVLYRPVASQVRFAQARVRATRAPSSVSRRTRTA